MSEEATIVWKLPRSQKGRLVEEARRRNLTLIGFLSLGAERLIEEGRGPAGGDAPGTRLEQDSRDAER